MAAKIYENESTEASASVFCVKMTAGSLTTVAAAAAAAAANLPTANQQLNGHIGGNKLMRYVQRKIRKLQKSPKVLKK